MQVTDAIVKAIKDPKTQIRINDTIAAGLAVVNLIVAYYENEDFYSTESGSNGETTKKRNESSDAGTAMRFINMLITGVLLLFIVLHYIHKLKIMK